MAIRYVVIDTETNGLPKEDRKGNADFSMVTPVSIAALGIEWEPATGEFKVVEAFNAFALLPEGLSMDKLASAVNGLTPEKLEELGALHLGEMLTQFKSFLKSFRSAILVGHNVMAFDIPVIVNAFVRAGKYGSEMIAFSLFDTQLIVKAFLLEMRYMRGEPDGFFWGRVRERKCEATVRLCKCRTMFCSGRSASDHPDHSALGDCYTTHNLFMHLIESKMFAEVFGRRAEEVLA